MILQALLLSTVFLASNNPSYNYACSTQAQVSFASTYASDIYANNICTFEFMTYYNNDENYVSYLQKIDLHIDFYDDEDDKFDEAYGSYIFATPIEFDLHNDEIFISYAYDGADLDYKFTYDNVDYLISLEDFIYTAAQRNSVPFPHIQFREVSIPFIIRSSLEGYNYNQGYDSGYAQGDVDGYARGHSEGYVEGIQYAQSQDQTALTIFTGICTVAMLPVNMFLTIFNFEVFGINIGGFISSFLTIAIVIIVIRMITGKKTDD